MALEHLTRSGGVGGAAATPPQRPPSPPASPPAAEEPGPDEPDITNYKHATIHQRNQPTSVTSIYEEDYGIGSFQDKPNL